MAAGRLRVLGVPDGTAVWFPPALPGCRLMKGALLFADLADVQYIFLVRHTGGTAALQRNSYRIIGMGLGEAKRLPVRRRDVAVGKGSCRKCCKQPAP